MMEIAWHVVPYRRLPGFPFPARICEMNDYDVEWSETEIANNLAIVKVKGIAQILNGLKEKYKQYKDKAEILKNEIMTRREPRHNKETDTIFFDGKIVKSKDISKVDAEVK